MFATFATPKNWQTSANMRVPAAGGASLRKSQTKPDSAPGTPRLFLILP